MTNILHTARIGMTMSGICERNLCYLFNLGSDLMISDRGTLGKLTEKIHPSLYFIHQAKNMTSRFFHNINIIEIAICNILYANSWVDIRCMETTFDVALEQQMLTTNGNVSNLAKNKIFKILSMIR